ncbi:hypothetical protein VBD025_11835 [Virgibacillus flavescens]|uniref:hypothetical protein n=1 Tax=Virgibacillus flavescens TaxID=1611422 RepID=UPI003D359983
MTLLGWIFWGIIAFIIILAFVLGRFVGGPGERSTTQIRAEQQAHQDSSSNHSGGL